MTEDISDDERKRIADRWAAVITQMSRYDLITPSQIRESMKNYQLVIDDSRYYESNPSDDKLDQSFYVDWYTKNLVTTANSDEFSIQKFRPVGARIRREDLPSSIPINFDWLSDDRPDAIPLNVKLTERQAERFAEYMFGLFPMPKPDDTDPAMQIDSVKVAKTRKAERARKFVNGKRARIGMRPVPFDWTEDDVIHCAEFEYHWKDEG